MLKCVTHRARVRMKPHPVHRRLVTLPGAAPSPRILHQSHWSSSHLSLGILEKMEQV